MRTRCLFILGITMSAHSTAHAQNAADQATVWFGTRGDAKGIYRSVLDLENGDLSPATVAAEIRNPGFLAIDKGGKHLYTIGEVAGSEAG